jgi:hypothetical protein
MEAFSVSNRAFPGAESTLILFIGSRTPDSSEIDALFVKWLETHVVDPVVMVIGEQFKLKAFLGESGRENQIEGLERLTRHSKLRLVGYDSEGALHEIGPGGVGVVDLGTNYRRAVAERIQQLVWESDIVVPAPPNFWFEKLSGRYASHFIRAESLLQSTTSIELLALALLKPFHDWWSKQSESIKERTSIFIDTMNIWPLAEKLTQLHGCQGRPDTAYTIQSFKSYDGFEQWTPLPRPSFVLISASTSGSLEVRVRKRIAPASVEIHTIIKLRAETNQVPAAGSGLVFELPRTLSGEAAFNGMRAEFIPAMEALPLGDESIQISGERFLNKYANPRLVRLIYTALDDSTRNALADLAQNNKLSVAQIKFDSSSRWAITFDGPLTRQALSSADGDKKSLLANWLRNYAFPGRVAVVYPSSNGTSAREVTNEAKAIAENAKDILGQFPGTDVVVLSSDQLLASSTRDQHQLDERGFIVICPVVGSGFVFKQIAAMLRTVQKAGPRLFLAFAALPESSAQYKQLNQDLSRSDDGVSYTFLCKHAFPVGRLEQTLNWQAEIEVMGKLLEHANAAEVKIPASVESRFNDLRDGRPLTGEKVFLPTLSGQVASLSSGFALWSGSDKIFGRHLGAAVLLTMATVLEATRSASGKTLATTLRKSQFQQALLDPENFTRYNDGVIQAAMLRAAYPSELDYRSHTGASNDMARLITKWVQFARHPIGDAAPEFLLALATGKLRLCQHHELAVLREAREAHKTSWLGILVDVCVAQLGTPIIS